MEIKQPKRAPKTLSTSLVSDVTREYPITFVAEGDLTLGPHYRFPIKIALPAGERCMVSFEVTPLFAFGQSVFRQALSADDIVAFHLGGCDVNAYVATKGGQRRHDLDLRRRSTPRAGEAYHPLRRPAPQQCETQDAKPKEAGRND